MKKRVILGMKSAGPHGWERDGAALASQATAYRPTPRQGFATPGYRPPLTRLRGSNIHAWFYATPKITRIWIAVDAVGPVEGTIDLGSQSSGRRRFEMNPLTAQRTRHDPHRVGGIVTAANIDPRKARGIKGDN